jgi:hypothetical protein
MNENIIGQILKDNFYDIHFVSEYEKRVIEDIINCRTTAMGGRIEHCDNCGHEIILYNSCRNRNCPNCQGSQSFKWLSKRLDETLPVSYFHCVFTIPKELKELFLYNKRTCLKILFKSVSNTLTQAAKRNLKIKIGFMSILHSWDQLLNFHPHIHCVAAGGGLNNDNSKWIDVKNKNYLLPVKKLSRVFRGKILFYLNKAFRKSLLKIDTNSFLSICNTVSKKDWVVFVKRPMGGAGQVLKYLSRYTHKIGISNRRILNYDGKFVTFSYRDRRDGNKEKTKTIPVILFIRKFMLHIIPRRFVKIRFYGFMVNRFRKKIIILRRELIMKYSSDLEYILPDISIIPFVNYTACPVCKVGKMRLLVTGENSS